MQRKTASRFKDWAHNDLHLPRDVAHLLGTVAESGEFVVDTMRSSASALIHFTTDCVDRLLGDEDSELVECEDGIFRAQRDGGRGHPEERSAQEFNAQDIE